MGRKPRELVPGGIYHLIQRGNNKNYIFSETRDKYRFMTILTELQESLDFSLFYHVLMDNHYHLILQTGIASPSAPVSKIMYHLNLSYTRYYNKRCSQVGTLYGSRYTGKLILDDQHLFRLLRYLAYNPVQAGMVKYPAEYRWSAHPAIRNNLSTPVDKGKVLSYFGKDPVEARKRYTAYIEEDSPKLISREEIQEKESRLTPEYLQYLLESRDLPESIMKMIRSGFSNAAAKEQRKLFIAAAYDAGYRRKDIAGFLSLSYETVRRLT
ncbi:MAG: transposase [Bacteroidetes bacterium]|nr:transposase [Bacteroidota bacterium]